MSTINNENEHLLEHDWVLWFRPPSQHSSSGTQAKAWEHSQKQSFKAGTVEDFWRGFHELPRITHGHSVNCDYSLFKEGIKPAWEDDFNKNGGRWTYSVERKQAGVPMPTIIEQVWLDVMLCLIGEGFDPHGEHIAGGVCGLRQARGKSPSDYMSAKIHIWTKDASDSEVNLEIGKILKNVLKADDKTLVYTPHDVNGSKGRGYNQGNLKL